MVGKPQDDWGREIDAHLPFYKSDCLQSDLRAVRQALRKAEAKLRRVNAAATGISELQGEEEAGLLYISAKMRELVQQARRVAASDATVLIRGESGVGKEGLARLLHHRSPRAAGPLLSVNCAAVPEGLLESELFGHVKGAFTGAVSERVGLFESARGGTLLLDEIGDVSPAMQAKLLRVLQEREVRRVGETKTRSIDVRILAATHRDLEAEVAAGRFRQDLYYRLRVIELLVPPLRERIEEVMPLAVRFLAEHAQHSGQPAALLSPEARRALLSYSWPGNVRELSNAIERAAVLAGGARIEIGDLPVELQRESSTAPSTAAAAHPALTLAEAERRHILGTLAAALGNRARAAQMLGIGQATLFRKLKQYGVTAG
jgi:transcriptional regulator with PAS, ATPase and Fis domain